MYFFLDRGSSDLSLDFGIENEDGRCFAKMELLSTSIHNWRWSDRIPTRPPKAQYPPRSTLMFGEVQIASIGVLVLFPINVAGVEREECSVRMESIIPMALNFTPKEAVLTSSL